MKKPLSKEEILCCYYARGFCNKGKNCPYSHDLSCKSIFNDKKLSALEIFKLANNKAVMNNTIQPVNGNENISSLKPFLESIVIMFDRINESTVISVFIKNAFSDLKAQCWYGFVKQDGPILPVLDHLVDRILKDMPYSFRKDVLKQNKQNKNREEWAWDNMYNYASCAENKPELDSFVLELRQRFVDLKKGIDKIYTHVEYDNKSEFDLMKQNFPALFETQEVLDNVSTSKSNNENLLIPLKLVKSHESKIDEPLFKDMIPPLNFVRNEEYSESARKFSESYDSIKKYGESSESTKKNDESIESNKKNDESCESKKSKKKKKKNKEKNKHKSSMSDNSTMQSPDYIKKSIKHKNSLSSNEAAEEDYELVEREIYPTYMDKYGRVWAYKPTGPYFVGLCP